MMRAYTKTKVLHCARTVSFFPSPAAWSLIATLTWFSRSKESYTYREYGAIVHLPLVFTL